MASGGRVPSDLNLNVGGIVCTIPSNIIERYPKSKLGILSSSEEITKDPEGNYFIDRDGSLFKYVRNFLLEGELFLPQCFDEFEQLTSEADFYQIGGLIEAIQISRMGRRIIPQPSDGLDVITVDDKGNEVLLTDEGQGGLIKKLFAGLMKVSSNGNTGNISESGIIKVHVFDLLYKNGFQLEGCNGQVNNHYYIFARKNKL